MPSTFAYIILYTWPLVVVLLFRRLPLRDALIWSIIAGYLLLPGRTGFDLPILPAVDKTLVPALSAAIMCFVGSREAKYAALKRARAQTPFRDRIPGNLVSLDFNVKRGRVLFWGLAALLILPPFITFAQNRGSVAAGVNYISGMKLYDVFSIISGALVMMVPFLLARRFLATDDSHKTLLRILALAGLGYSFLALYEVRMSPQLNQMFYGFFPHNWAQHVRGDGYRPLVFLNHGLWLAIIMACSIIAAIALWRAETDQKIRTLWGLASAWLLFTLVLCKSLGALLLVIVFGAVMLVSGTRSRMLFVAVVSAIVLVFPIARSAGLVPVGTIYNIAASINTERASSLKYRLDNEDILLEKANEKPIAGWGIWGRARIYKQSGENDSVTDGYWIIVMGQFGWLGYFGRFGLLCLPLILLGVRARRLKLTPATSGLALVLGVSLVDLIPNATISPVVWLVAGAIMGKYQTAELTEKPSTVRAGSVRRATPKPATGPPPPASERPRPLHQRRPRT